MQLDFDTLHYVKMLTCNGIQRPEAEAIVEALSRVGLRNLYTKEEVNEMIADSVQKVLDDNRRAFEREMEIRVEEMNKRSEESAKRFESDRAEARSARRWMVGTIITCSLGLAGYLSVLIRLTH